MLRRSLVALSKPAVQTGRTIVRDPRKAKQSKQSAVAATSNQSHHQHQSQQYQSAPKPLPFAPSEQNQQSMGIGSYFIAGVGVALGFTLVGALFGG